jgi:hypothetical protein
MRTPQPGISDGDDDGGIAYIQGWSSNVKINSNCWTGDVYLYKVIPANTINNKIYSNLIYSELQTKDSSFTNLDYYVRKIYFAKHIGIIKYFKVSRYYNIHRSYSLLRFKVLQ